MRKIHDMLRLKWVCSLSDRQIAQIGQMDVVLAPVDGSYTLDTPGMIEVLKGLKAPLVIPMHFRTLRYKPRNMFWINNFLSMFDEAIIDFACDCEVTVMPSTLPDHMRILVLDNIS